MNFTQTRIHGSVGHALSVWHIERALFLPSEAHLEHLVLAHRWLMEGFNAYYAAVHFPALIIFLIWLFARYRHRYRSARTVLILVTTAAAVLQMIPVAPPRMLTRLGFVDAALALHQSVYGAGGNLDPGQLTAMPSVHVAWAVLIAVVVIQVARTRWRWLILIHPLLTMLVVVATGNHWWLDGIVGCGLLAFCFVIERWRAWYPYLTNEVRIRDGDHRQGHLEGAGDGAQGRS